MREFGGEMVPVIGSARVNGNATARAFGKVGARAIVGCSGERPGRSRPWL